MKEHFRKLAATWMSQTHLGPDSLAELLEQVYESGVIDERYGEFGTEAKPVIEEQKMEVEQVAEAPYQACVNEYTPVKFQK